MTDAAALARRLDELAERLRSGTLDPGEAAELVDQCADLAAQMGAELDAQSRAASEAEGQERLL